MLKHKWVDSIYERLQNRTQKIVKLLCIDLNTKNICGLTPFMNACKIGHKKLSNYYALI